MGTQPLRRLFRSLVAIPEPDFRLVGRTAQGIGIKVAVIDTGCAEGTVVRQFVSPSDMKDFTQSNGTCNDDCGHGTLVASIIKRYAPGVRLAIAKVAVDPGAVHEVRVLSALDWAYKWGAQVINLSLGFDMERKCLDGICTLCGTVAAIHQQGVVVVVAAGNKHPDSAGPEYIKCPGISEYALTVGAVDTSGRVAQYSVLGVSGRQKPDLLAPGTVEFNHKIHTGTSFAAPLVTAAVATMGQLIGSPKEAANLLKDTAVPVEDPVCPTGRGVLNLTRTWEVVSGARSDRHSQG